MGDRGGSKVQRQIPTESWPQQNSVKIKTMLSETYEDVGNCVMFLLWLITGNSSKARIFSFFGYP